MISHLRGQLVRKNELVSSVDIDVNGVWYEVELPAFVWRALEDHPMNQKIELETFYFVTANTPIPRLIGFQREIEREFFRKLIEVPNIGPSKAAKALVFSVSTIAGWIESGDTLSITGLPGIGRRSAEVIVAQLRGKMAYEALLSDERFAKVQPEPAPSDVAKDTMDALVNLGYGRAEAERMVSQAEAEAPSANVEEAIRAVFRRRGSQTA